MPTDLPAAAAPAHDASTFWRLAPFLLLLCLALPDLLAPPISPTILRQTQTFAQTKHFVDAGFSPEGLWIDIDGPRPFRVVHELPLYHAIVGTWFAVFGPSFLAGKLVSLLAAFASLRLFQNLVRAHAGEAIALRATFLFASCPIALLLATAFQPDAFALALTLLSIAFFVRWRTSPTLGRWLVFLIALLGAALAKFTILVPFTPLLVAGALRHAGKTRIPRISEIAASLLVFFVPFVSWYLYRTGLIDPGYRVEEQQQFFFGDVRRFLHVGFYFKPAFIIGAMVCCGAGVVFLLAGLRRPGPVELLLLAGVPFYFILLPTAADQTYYAYALAPALVFLMGRGLLVLERGWAASWRRPAQIAAAFAWVAGFAVAAPYTLRRDEISLAAAAAAREHTQPTDFLLVMNMHDRGVGIGGFNPSIVTLAERRGWNIRFTPELAALRSQIEQRRAEGARWLVTTWFTSDLDPWFTPLLPASFSRCPRFGGAPVDGRAIADELARDHPAIARGPNFAILRLGSP